LETGSVSVVRRGEGYTYSVGPLERAYLNHCCYCRHVFHYLQFRTVDKIHKRNCSVMHHRQIVRTLSILRGSERFLLCRQMQILMTLFFLKNVFWDVTLCESCKNRRFGGMCCLHQCDNTRLAVTCNRRTLRKLLVTLFLARQFLSP
jgi:hypothetical protein